MKLLIDLGNTRLKWALWDGAEMRSRGALAHAGSEPIDFAALWKDIHELDAAWIASVAAPALDASLAESLRARAIPEPHFVRSCAQACGVRNAYAQPQRLGVDRFLSLIAAHGQAAQPTVIASCGTALTLDALAPDGTHLGGLIAPAPELMRSALLGHTARLGDVDDAGIVEMANNTADAVASGTWLAAVALIERFVAQAAQRMGVTPALVLSGGGASQLADLIALPLRIDSELVLRGLALFADATQAPAVG
jgi:type III pantothenate kinase